MLLQLAGMNLVGKDNAECSPASISYYDFLEKYFVFFTALTQYFSKLNANLKDSQCPMPQRIAEAKWSAKADSSKAVVFCYKIIHRTLNKIVNDPDEFPRVQLVFNLWICY